jgi:hypothetical protein
MKIFMKRAVLLVIALAAVMVAVPAQSASAYEHCLAAVAEDQPPICFGSTECERVAGTLRKLGVDTYCLQSTGTRSASASCGNTVVDCVDNLVCLAGSKAGLQCVDSAAATQRASARSCTTVIILGQKTCFESIPCDLRDAVAAQDERVGALVRKWAAYECIQ